MSEGEHAFPALLAFWRGAVFVARAGGVKFNGPRAPRFLVWNVDPALHAVAPDVLRPKRLDKPLRHFGAGFPRPYDRYSLDILEFRASDLEGVASNV